MPHTTDITFPPEVRFRADSYWVIRSSRLARGTWVIRRSRAVVMPNGMLPTSRNGEVGRTVSSASP